MFGLLNPSPGDVLSGVIFDQNLYKINKNDEFQDLGEPGPFQKEQARSADQKNGTQTSGR